MKQDPQMTEEERVWLSLVRRQVRSLHFGVVQIVVHNSQVVQIERTEKLRLNEATRLTAEGNLRSMEGI
ncbi:MAG TPA: YezD family protein [Verrucomicrobiae bacterium]|nr:YezD family protein [Verrucomicrobiae bacterium]